MRRHAKAPSFGSSRRAGSRPRLALAGFALLALTLALGVSLAGAAAPVVTIEDATEVQYTTAHAKGEVNPEGKGTSYHFEYASEADFSNASFDGFGSTESTITPELQIGGLQPATTYHLRLVASNEDGEVQVEAASTFTTKAVAKPSVSGLAASATHFSAMVNPNAPEENALLSQPAKDAYATHWSFTCEPGCSFSGPGGGNLPADNSATEVSADPTGLQPNKPYNVTLHATNAGGEESETLLEAFTTPAVKPDIERETLWEPTETSIQLNARVNAHNAVLTDCHFEYGAGGNLDHTAPCEAPIPGNAYTAPSNEGFATVSARISGLSPNTEYSFRLVATNSAGTGEGEVRSFSTLAEPGEESCSNQGFREAQHATRLPDCRAFEKVSPEEKGNGDIVGDGATTVAAKLGDAVAFNTRTPFGDTIGSGTIGQTQYVARRAAQGWDVHAITPTPRPDAKQTFFSNTLLQIYSDDLRAAVVRAYDLPAATDDMPLRNNLYVEDTATRALRTATVSQVDVPSIFEFLNWPLSFWGISADARHVAFVTATQFLPDAAPGVPNVYAWDDGVLRVASVLPGGTVPTEGAETPENLRGAMSADGSRLLFTASTGVDPQLFMRIDAARTAWVSQTELDPLDPRYQPNPSNVRPLGMTPDGRSVFFTTDTPLLPDDANSGTDLYRYTDSADPSSDGNLTLISQDGDLDNADLVGMSDDGQRVYFHTTTNRLVVWDHGTSRLISNTVPFLNNETDSFGLTNAIPGYARVTPDGMFMAFGIKKTVDGVHGFTGEVTNGHREMYLYSLGDHTLRCVSCPSVPATSDATVLPEATQGEPTLGNAGFRPRFLSEDGRVFFSSGDALVAQDTNGVLDTYEYDPVTGRVSLLSTGTGSDPATFADASASGDDVFIVTRQRLVAYDHDDLVDLYDVGVNRGLPEPEESVSPPCSGDGCKPAPSASPGAPSGGTSLLGFGNLHRRARCTKNQRKVRRNGKVRCVRRHHKHKRANTNRRAGR